MSEDEPFDRKAALAAVHTVDFPVTGHNIRFDGESWEPSRTVDLSMIAENAREIKTCRDYIMFAWNSDLEYKRAHDWQYLFFRNAQMRGVAERYLRNLIDVCDYDDFNLRHHVRMRVKRLDDYFRDSNGTVWINKVKNTNIDQEPRNWNLVLPTGTIRYGSLTEVDEIVNIRVVLKPLADYLRQYGAKVVEDVSLPWEVETT